MQNTRFSHPNANDGRPQCSKAPPNEGATAIGRLKGPNRQRFEEIFATGSRASGERLRVYALPGSGLLGIATARAIGEKPQRNRQRRRIRESIRLLDLCTNSWDIIIFAKPSITHATFEEIQEEARRHINDLITRSVDA